MPKLKPRIWLIEDNPVRIEMFRQWLLDTPFQLVSASSGGQALGLVRFGAAGLAAICLDFDLNTNTHAQGEEHVNGAAIANAIVQKIPKHIPILIHSMSPTGAPRMHHRLMNEGFSATRITFENLNKNKFLSWLEEVKDNWDWEEEE